VSCQRCEETTVISISGKCFDRFNLNYHDIEYSGYVPGYLGIGNEDYIEFDYCTNCGQIQGNFPINLTSKDFIKEEV